MLNGQPTVFLSCSEKFKAVIAIPVRHGLRAHGVHGVIVSAEPQLPRTGWEPDDKVDNYMNASDAFTALCTPDDELTDGTVQCRPNIIDEIQRARSKPHLRDRIMVFKSPFVRLPSNINPLYERLDADDIKAAVELIMRQMQTWGVLAGERSAPLIQTFPHHIPVDEQLAGLGLGDHDKATARAYRLAMEAGRSAQREFIEDLRQRLHDTGDDTNRHIIGSMIEGMARVDVTLISADMIEELADSDETTDRMSAVFVLWVLAETAPGLVPLGTLGRLARPSEEDWYVQAPAMAITKLLMLHRQHAQLILDRLARSSDPTDRHEVALALLDLSSVDATAVPPDLAQRLARDTDNLVAEKGREVAAAIAHLDEHAYTKRFSPFGI